MMQKLQILLGGVAASVLLTACATGIGLPGAPNGCRTIYVLRPSIGGAPGAVQPVNSCTAVPRDRLLTQALAANGEEPVSPARLLVSVSDAAQATRPLAAPAEAYPGPSEMLENGDMAAFMALIRSDLAADRNHGAWGYAIVDALAADNPPAAQDVLDAMAMHPSPEILSAEHLRPWVLASAGRSETAQSEMAQLRRILPGATLLGHRALLAEGLGDAVGALVIYDEAPDDFDPPDPEDAATPGFLARAVAFNGQRALALRQAELLRSVNRDPEAIELFRKLLAASPDDAYVQGRLEKAEGREDRRPVRTLKQALALAIADEADLVEERQAIMGMMVGRGAKAPFNHLLASLRQSALLLDPDNGEIRLAEVGALYQHGHFEAALRLAQIGSPPLAQMANLASAAGLAALELGSPEAMSALIDRALVADSSPDAKLSAASALTTAGRTDRAIQLIDQAIRAGVPDSQRVFALMSRGQARFQGGDVAGAVQAGRDARALEDNENTQQFLASMLVKSPQRPEGLAIMREMMTAAPGNVGLMNNFGYSLIDDHASREELDEGFKLLKEASRLSPDEPNLLDSLGWAYYSYGDFREARRYLGLALENYKPFRHWELHDHMGDIEWRLGDQEAARTNWQAALGARPPLHNEPAIRSKLVQGLAKPAPETRDTPEVPLNQNRGQSSDI
ncbi:MAG: tetratricopeptide repeat protein [Alphaproteobacteria bacterium]|nr:tetratricopeptide repeat protein [Alphaproteobacteria bacterium]